MSLYLGKLGRVMVQKAIASPHTWGKVGQVVGKVLPKCLWKATLTTNAFKLSSVVKPGDRIDIIKGKVIRDQAVLLEIPDLFGSISIFEMDIDEKMCTPEGMASFLRWNIFYDKKKIFNFAMLTSMVATGNMLLDKFIYGLITPSSHPAMDNSNSIFAFKPNFHSLDDPAQSFSVGEAQIAFLEHPLIFSLPILAATYSILEFHQNEGISYPPYRKISNITNLIVAVGLGGVLSHLYLFNDLRGVVDYFTVYYGENDFSSFNLGDLLTYTALGAFYTKVFSVALAWKHGPRYGFTNRS